MRMERRQLCWCCREMDSSSAEDGEQVEMEKSVPSGLWMGRRCLADYWGVGGSS